MLLKTNDVIKRRRRDIKIYKAMKITFDIHEINKEFTTAVQLKNACKLEFVDHLWPTFLDQPQSNIIVFAIITF